MQSSSWETEKRKQNLDCFWKTYDYIGRKSGINTTKRKITDLNRKISVRSAWYYSIFNWFHSRSNIRSLQRCSIRHQCFYIYYDKREILFSVGHFSVWALIRAFISYQQWQLFSLLTFVNNILSTSDASFINTAELKWQVNENSIKIRLQIWFRTFPTLDIFEDWFGISKEFFSLWLELWIVRLL